MIDKIISRNIFTAFTYSLLIVVKDRFYYYNNIKKSFKFKETYILYE